MFLSVIIPAYNEVRSIKKNSLKPLFSYLKKQSFSWEVIIVNDGSTDRTYKMINKHYQSELNLKIINNDHLGKGASLISGFKHAKGKYLLFTDFDQSTPITQFDKLKKYLNKYDFIIGSRLARSNAPFTRKIVSQGFILLRKIILDIPYHDTQCGFKLLSYKSFSQIVPHTSTFKKMSKKSSYFTDVAFDLELLLIAQKQKLKIKEVAVEWKHEPRDLNLNKLIIDVMIDLLKVKIKLIKGFYDK